MVGSGLQSAQALAVIAIAAFGAWIAFRQMQIANSKLLHDLYEKRYRIYDATRTMLNEAVQHQTMSQETLRAFILGTGDATFLLSDELAGYLVEMSEHARRMQAITITMEALPVGDEKARASRAAGADREWLVNQIDGLAAKFEPCLRLSKRKRKRRLF